MGFWDQLQASKKTNIEEWITLKDINQLEELIKESFERSVVIFKHSTRCGTSAQAKFRIENDWSQLSKKLSFYYLDLIEYRAVSNEVARKFNITHQSPQVIVLKNGKSVYNRSHHMIDVSDLSQEI